MQHTALARISQGSLATPGSRQSAMVPLTAGTREFKEQGEFSDLHEPFLESIRKRQASIKKKLDSAIQHGAKRDLIKYEAERDFNGLIEEFLQWEKQLDAESMKRAGE
jgi:hypothetical protein